MSLEALRDFDKGDKNWCFSYFLERERTLKTLIAIVKLTRLVFPYCLIQMNNEFVI